MDDGISYADVQAAVDTSLNIVSDPPVVPDMDLARRQVAALDELPRPTAVTCRAGPRSSALVYLYAGLRAGASASDVLARARADGAPFVGNEALEDWVTQGLDRAGVTARPRSADRHHLRPSPVRLRTVGGCRIRRECC